MEQSASAAHRLAIVIPAYKPEFLAQTLDSLKNQTCRDFTVYLGDDGSPADLGAIAEGYREALDIRYRRFEENLGGRDLTAHWKRCVDMTEGEEFFCLFSDDDIMEPDCVRLFYEQLDTEKAADVYHFDLKFIDEKGTVLGQPGPYPPELPVNRFFSLLYSGKIDARMPEFIFRRERFFACGGFVEFDLAWRSDNATVIRCGLLTGIRTIPGACVRWRFSGANVSHDRAGAAAERKDTATVAFFNWVDRTLEEAGAAYELGEAALLKAYCANLLCVRRGASRRETEERMAQLRYVDSPRRRAIFRAFALAYRGKAAVGWEKRADPLRRLGKEREHE